jgi:uncharacterized membrane protein YphA (DoxX/SURF4 family)
MVGENSHGIREGAEGDRMAAKQTNSTVVWVVTFLLTALFVWMGATMVGSEQWSADFQRWGYPVWLCPVIGVVEVVGGILLLVRRVAWVGAVTLALLMVGAVTTTLRHEGAGAALMPALLLTSLTSLTYYRFPRKQLPAAPEAH